MGSDGDGGDFGVGAIGKLLDQVNNDLLIKRNPSVANFASADNRPW